MIESKFFNGQIVRSQDLNFNNSGFSSSITDLASNISNQSGGILEGLQIYPSANGMSLLVNPGTFYSAQGEFAQIFSMQTFTNLNPTQVIANQNSILLVYAIVTTQNQDPNPVAPKIIYSATNVQTGVTQPVRTYNVGSIIISNPIFRSEISNFNGVILGALTVSPTNQILSIDTSVRQDFLIGGAIDATTQSIVSNAIPNNFITTRMIGSGQIISTQFANNSIASLQIALYDGSSSNWLASGSNFVTGSGVGTLQLKSQAVTQSTMSYSGSVSNFSSRNRLVNSSFEQGLTGWNVWSGSSGANSSTSGVSITNTEALYGSQSAQLTAISLLNVPQSVGITQTVNFNDNLQGKPISAFVSVQASNTINLAVSGTTGILGQLDFLSTGGTVISSQSVQFGYSGTSQNWQTIYTSAPIYPTVSCSQVAFTIFGSFDNTFYIDGAFLGETALLPAYDVNPNEYVINSGVSFNTISGTLLSSQLPYGTNSIITTSNIATQTILGSNIASNTIGGINIAQQTIQGGPQGNIASGTITNGEISSSVILGIPSGFITFTADPTKSCPTGFIDVTATWAGYFAIGFNPNSSVSNINTVGAKTGAGATDTTQIGNHDHFGSDVGNGAGGAGGYIKNNQTTTNPVPLPIIAVRFCQKT